MASPSSSLKVCILAAGYGTRLERDIRDDPQGAFKHLIGVPKPLVPINSVPLLTRWIRLLLAADAGLIPADIFIVGNGYNHVMLITWLATLAEADRPPECNVINDGSLDNASRLGAVKDIDLLIQTKLISGEGDVAAANTSLLVIGGDTLFYPDFPLHRLLSDFHASPAVSRVLWYPVASPERYGILEVSSEGLVQSFREKPRADETDSRKACPCFYLLSAAALCKVHPFVQAASTLSEVDAPGNFLRHLVSLNLRSSAAAASVGEDAHSMMLPIAADEIRGRFDIGGLDTYVQCDQWFREAEKKKKKNEGDKHTDATQQIS